uniref:Uncharacterized protein n=1 Tax=Romanomermis culicivorax TaxID=13658 RepID=A0A915K638_ROMCU
MADDQDLLSNSLNHTWLPVVDPIVGTIYILLAVVLLVPYFICIYIMSTDDTLKGSSFFRIAIHIGVTDVLQIFFNSIVGGLLTLTNYQGFWLNNTSAAVTGFGWTACLSVAHLMAFNRFVYIYWPDKVKYFFSPRATSLALAGCWLSGVLWLTVLMNPNLRSMMNRSVSKDSRRDVKILAQAVFLCALVIATTITFTIDQYVITHWSISFLTNILWLSSEGYTTHSANAPIYQISRFSDYFDSANHSHKSRISEPWRDAGSVNTIKRRFIEMFNMNSSSSPTTATVTPNEVAAARPNRIVPENLVS